MALRGGAFLDNKDKSSEKLISYLEEAFKKEEKYNYLDYLKNNTGLFISAISIVSAIMLFLARIISYIVVNARYQYWNLDEGFLVEDNKMYLKLGVLVLYFIFTMLINSVAKRYVYRWKLNDCKVYLYGKIFEDREKHVKLKRKAIRDLKKMVADIVKTNESINEEKLESVNCEIKKLESENKELIRQCIDNRLEVLKIRISLFFRIIPSFILIFMVSLFLQYVFGIEIENHSTMGLIQLSLITALIIILTAIFCAVLEIKLTLLVSIKRFFKDDKVDGGSEYMKPVIEWLDTKIAEQSNHSLKSSLSDKTIKLALGNVALSALIIAIFLKWNVTYSLDHAKSFYVFNENNQDYVMIINDGTKYILSECDIVDEEIIIDTNQIIVRNNPINLEKMSFNKVEKKTTSGLK